MISEHRLDHELGVIKKMGFAGYFLITADFVKYAKDNMIPVGQKEVRQLEVLFHIPWA